MSKDTDDIANPNIAFPAAPDPVVSPVPLVNDTEGAFPNVYDPTSTTVTVSTDLPKTPVARAPVPEESVIVTSGVVLYPLPLVVTAIAVISPAVTVTAPKTASTPLKNIEPEPTALIPISDPLFAFDSDDATLMVLASTRIA